MKTSFRLPLLSSKLLLICLLLAFCTTTKAQDCATPDIPIEEMRQLPWFGNPNYLPAFMDSINRIHNTSVSRVENNIIWRIPIRFWILTEGNVNPLDLLDDGEVTNGTPNRLPQERELQRLVDDANFAFRTADAPTNIRFYMEPARLLNVNNSDMSNTNLFLHLSANPAFMDNEAINVYIRSGIDKDQYFTPVLGGYIVLQRRTYTDSGLATSLTHEIGHYLGLAHTHQYTKQNIPCLREPVTRGRIWDGICPPPILSSAGRCSITGDGLCDTEADPNMLGNYSNLNATTGICTYTGTKTDYRDERFRPLRNNYMAYGNGVNINNRLESAICRSQFTRDQVGVMQSTLQNTLRGKFGKWKVDAAGRGFDMYEPNNTINGAENSRGIVNAGIITLGRRGLTNALQLNLPQTHSFHKSLDGQVRDNEDWIPIETPPNGVIDNYTITVQSTIANLVQDVD